MHLAPISVVIPAYNSQEFIGESISSVKAQTLPVSEIIVVDDGSDDRTADVAARYAVTVIQRPHGGVSAARNTGIRAAKYDWIALQDADDIWDPRKIEYQWQAIRCYPDVGLVSCGLGQWTHGSPAPEPSAVSNGAELQDRMKYISDPNEEFLARQMNYYSPTILMRRELLVSVGLFDESVEFQEGVECYLRILARAPVVMIELALAHQRIHGQNTSGDSIGMRLAWIKLIDELKARPEKYPPGAAHAFGKDYARVFVPLGRELLDKGRMNEARALFSRHLTKQFSGRALFLWTLSFLSPANFKSLLSCKRKLISLSHRFTPGRETVPN